MYINDKIFKFQFIVLKHEVENGKLKVENEGIFFENIFK